MEWKSDPVTLKVEIRDINGSPVISKKILLSDIQSKSMELAATGRKASHQNHCSLEVDLPWIVRYRLAILVFVAIISRKFSFLLKSYILIIK